MLSEESFGTIIITKDRNWCLKRTITALQGSELAEFPIVIVNNGSTSDNPLDVLTEINFDYVKLQQNIGIVGARIYAHWLATNRGWARYCFLQDDFEMKVSKLWLRDTLEFMRRFHIDYCRLTSRESACSENEHWVKGVLRVQSKERFWNCSHIQNKKFERLGRTNFSITDKHYSDWVHIISAHASRVLFDISPQQLCGPTVSSLLLNQEYTKAFQGAIRSEFDFSVKHWIAYTLGMVSATGILEDPSCWCGAFDHFTGHSTLDYRDLPDNPLEHIWKVVKDSVRT
jgi:hypothetical protein